MFKSKGGDVAMPPDSGRVITQVTATITKDMRTGWLLLKDAKDIASLSQLLRDLLDAYYVKNGLKLVKGENGLAAWQLKDE